jgi:catechol 2,3-dioxygenase-like lactoylglutathione lyase family enzyme
MPPEASMHADILAVHSIDEFVFSVPDLAIAQHFYTSFGLDVRNENGALALYTFGHPHRWARVMAGESKRILWLTLGIHAQDAPRFASLLAQRGIALVDPPPDAKADAQSHHSSMWITGPDQLPIKLRVAEKTSPSQPAPRESAPPTGNAGRAPSRSKIDPVHPLHLSHILLFSADVDAAREFYEGLLGFRLSDKSGAIIAFMHTPHGSDHHLIALAKSRGLGLHHSSWCVPSIDAVGLGSQQMEAAGYAQGWGIGRHVLGSNYFRYVRDPWGSYAEYSYDIDFIQAGYPWPAADHASEDSLYVWGPAVPQDFITNFEQPGA